MMKKNSSFASWICLTLVLAMAGVMVPTLAAAAPPHHTCWNLQHHGPLQCRFSVD